MTMRIQTLITRPKADVVMRNISLSIILLIILIPSVISVSAYTPISPHDGLHRDHSFNTAEAYRSCGQHCFLELTFKYGTLYDIYGLELDNKTKFIEAQTTQVKHLSDEVNLWKNKYNHLLTQQSTLNIQDQVINLTERITALENKTAFNEGVLYKLQNIIRTVQVDIADIYLKINSVR